MKRLFAQIFFFSITLFTISCSNQSADTGNPNISHSPAGIQINNSSEQKWENATSSELYLGELMKNFQSKLQHNYWCRSDVTTLTAETEWDVYQFDIDTFTAWRVVDKSVTRYDGKYKIDCDPDGLIHLYLDRPSFPRSIGGDLIYNLQYRESNGRWPNYSPDKLVLTEPSDNSHTKFTNWDAPLLYPAFSLPPHKLGVVADPASATQPASGP